MNSLRWSGWSFRHKSSKQALIGVVYRPPNSDTNFIYMDRFEETILLAKSEQKEIDIVGDMNCNMLKSDASTTQLLDILGENGRSQLVTLPTRIASESKTLLDLFITSQPSNYPEVKCQDCCISDHQLISGVSREQMETCTADILMVRSHMYRKCNSNALQKDLNTVPWHVLEI